MALPTPYKHNDGRNLHLGKGPAKLDSRRFMLSSFLPMATPPVSVNWFGSVTEFGSMLNDSLEDCTCAAVGHAEQVASLNTPEGELTFPDNIILNLYEKSCGYVFNDPSTDNGGVITDVLDWVRKYGMGKKHETPDIHRKKILYAYADPNPDDIAHVKQAIAEFAVVDIGLQLPITAQSQVGKVWDVVGDPNSNNDSRPGSWGGHCLTGDTSISLLDGREISIVDALAEFGTGKFDVYSYDFAADKLRPGTAWNLRKTGVNREVVRVTLDNGESFKCTPDHRLMALDGSWIVPTVGASMIGLYRWVHNKYEMSRISRWTRPTPTHQCVAETIEKPDTLRYIGGEDNGGWVVHHAWNESMRAFNELDNRPSMLEWMRWKAHQLYHKRSPEQREISRKNMSKLWADLVWREAALLRLADNLRKARIRIEAEGIRTGFQTWSPDQRAAAALKTAAKLRGRKLSAERVANSVAGRLERHRTDPEFAARMAETSRMNLSKTWTMPVTEAQRQARSMNALRLCYRRFMTDKFTTFDAFLDHRQHLAAASPNHKIVAVESAGREDVYDLNVDTYHNFALSAGVFAHNSVIVSAYDANTVTCITWGQLQPMTWDFWNTYVDESHALLMHSWLDRQGATSAVNLAALEAALQALNN